MRNLAQLSGSLYYRHKLCMLCYVYMMICVLLYVLSCMTDVSVWLSFATWSLDHKTVTKSTLTHTDTSQLWLCERELYHQSCYSTSVTKWNYSVSTIMMMFYTHNNTHHRLHRNHSRPITSAQTTTHRVNICGYHNTRPDFTIPATEKLHRNSR